MAPFPLLPRIARFRERAAARPRLPSANEVFFYCLFNRYDLIRREGAPLSRPVPSKDGAQTLKRRWQTYARARCFWGLQNTCN